MPAQAVCTGSAKEVDLDGEGATLSRYDLVCMGPFECPTCRGGMFVRGGGAGPGTRFRLHFSHYHDCTHVPADDADDDVELGQKRAAAAYPPSLGDSLGLLRPRDDPVVCLGVAKTHLQTILNYTEDGALLRVRAVAGAGKSTLLSDYVKLRCTSKERALVLYFNKSPVEELQQSLGDTQGCIVCTMDSLFNVKEKYPNMTLVMGNEDYPGLEGSCLNPGKHKRHAKCSFCMPVILASLKEFLASADPKPTQKHCMQHVAKKYKSGNSGMCCSAVELVQRVWGRICKLPAEAKRDTAIVKKLIQVGAETPFGNMDYFLEGFRYLLIDECQDLSACEASLLLRKRPGTTLIAVGDELQNINQFRGSSELAFRDMDCSRSITLPCTWRFSYPLNAFVEHVCKKGGASEIDILSGTPGSTDVVQVSGIKQVVRLLGSDGIKGLTGVFRTNSKMLEAMFELFDCSTSVSATPGLKVHAPSLQEKFGPELQALSQLFAFCMGNGKPSYEGFQPPHYIWNFDKYVEHCHQYGKQSNLLACKFVSYLREVRGMTKGIFELTLRKIVAALKGGNGQDKIGFFTAHGAKGMTLDRVYVADDFTMDSAEDVNCLYVALTRARKACYVHDQVYKLMDK